MTYRASQGEKRTLSPAEKAFRETVRRHARKHGRTLPWRLPRGRKPSATDAYRVFISEVMLQQTQVDRVIPFYRRFIRTYPSVRRLAQASFPEVYRLWQGLGYNRRARNLIEATRLMCQRHGARVPSNEGELRALPGVGAYSAAAVLAFGFDKPAILIETNIRTALIHHFFASKKSVHDHECANILARLLPRRNIRAWYGALMDYGASLKQKGVRYNARVEGYVKQKPFAGSSRQARGAILRLLMGKKRTPLRSLYTKLPHPHGRIEGALATLLADGLIKKKKGMIVLA